MFNDEAFYNRYVKNDKILGNNEGALKRMIEMLKVSLQSTDKDVVNITENINKLETLAPNFMIFQAEGKKETYFMPNFNAINIDIDVDDLSILHEFGHAILKIMNNKEMPENYKEVIEGAQKHTRDSEINAKLKESMRYMTDKEKSADMKGKAPYSDIISGMWQTVGFRTSTGEELILPYRHTTEYYQKGNSEEVDYLKVFDEHFANFYALKADNCQEELDMLKDIFGEEWYNTMETQIEKASQKIQTVDKSEKSPETAQDKIKSIITGVTKSEVEGVNLDLEKENAKEENEQEEEK